MGFVSLTSYFSFFCYFIIFNFPRGDPTNEFKFLCKSHYKQEWVKCKEHLNHKSCLISPKLLQDKHIPYDIIIQHPGEDYLLTLNFFKEKQEW